MEIKKLAVQILTLLALCSLTVAAQAESGSLASSSGLFVYPAENQSEEQQGKDDYECFTWSKKQTGHDPMNASAKAPAVAEAPAAESTGRKRDGKRLKGAVRGAAVGSVVDEIHEDDIGGGAAYDRHTGNDNKAAKTAAVVGAARGGRESRRAKQSAAQAPSQTPVAATDDGGESEGFKKAFSACLSARGYSVQ